MMRAEVPPRPRWLDRAAELRQAVLGGVVQDQAAAVDVELLYLLCERPAPFGATMLTIGTPLSAVPVDGPAARGSDLAPGVAG